MGQLERYGLYVLCVVIVLILGVAIWGGDGTAHASGPKMRPLEQLATSPQRGSAVGEPKSTTPVQTPPANKPEPDNFYEHRSSTSFDELDQLAGVAGVVEVDPTVGKPKAPETARKEETQKKRDSVNALRTYTVKRGDTMEDIALKLLGSRKQTSTIRKLNPDVNPRKMKPGIVLKLPWNESLANGGSKGDGKWREYTVKSGDNASAISIEMYGTAKYANRILEVNGIKDARKMKLNSVLKIPPVQ